MTWHIDTATVDRYSAGDTDVALVASVEAHVLACEQCRSVVNASADAAVLDVIWESIEDVLDTPRASWIERLLLAAGCSDTTARIVAATTRARWAYLFIVAFNVAVAIVSAGSTRPDEVFLVFLLLAPLGPLAATAGAFGRLSDPAHALMRVLPTPTLRVVLVRTVAGVVPAVVLTAASLPWLADRGWAAVAWLLPALALTLITLALSTWIDVELAATLVGGVWIALPLALRLPVSELLELLTGQLQIASVAAGAIATATAIARRTKFDYGEV